jgi:hypothetical protein
MVAASAATSLAFRSESRGAKRAFFHSLLLYIFFFENGGN